MPFPFRRFISATTGCGSSFTFWRPSRYAAVTKKQLSLEPEGFKLEGILAVCEEQQELSMCNYCVEYGFPELRDNLDIRTHKEPAVEIRNEEPQSLLFLYGDGVHFQTRCGAR